MAQKDIRFTFKVQAAAEDNQPDLAFDVVSFRLEEGLNDIFQLEVELTSFDDQVDFALLLDQPALFTIYQKGTAVRYVHGHISDFYQNDTGFHRTRYYAIVEPWLSRLQLCSDWRIFQQQDATQIVQEIFKLNRLNNHIINASQQHKSREYCVQAGLSDFDFIQRLLAQEGFIYRFEHTALTHQLIISDVIQSFGALNDSSGTGTSSITSILYQPTPGGDKQQPALRTFSYSEHVRTAQQTQRDYTFKNPRYSQEHNRHGHDIDHQSSQYEQYRYPGDYKEDEVGAPFTQTRILSIRNDAKMAQASGDDARIQPGVAFKLTGHNKQSLNTLWRAVKIQHKGTQYTSVEEESATSQQSTSYEQTAQLVPANANWKAPIPEIPFIKGPFIAHVTGPKDEEIYTDEFARVRVIFPWDRYNAANEHSSCWIRVAQNWAGAGWGHMALPRIGQEVIVDFLGGDESQPIIIGRTYDAQHPTPYKLPALKAQATIKSKEHKGSGYNEFLIDDTTGEVKTQLHSTHGTTQLTMGFLTHPRKEDGNGEHRGDGFELRTDEWGAIRAGKGLYISTDKRDQAKGKQLDLQEAMTQLEQAISITESLRKAAEVAKAELADLQRQKDLMSQTMRDLKQAGILINAPDGVSVSSPKVVQVHAGENLFFTSGVQTDLSSIHNLTVNAGKTLSLLGISNGVKLYAMQGNVNIEAQKDQMNLTSVKDMTIMSTQGKTEVIAKEELVLSCGGSYLRLKDGLIELGSKGPVMVRAAGLNLVGPDTLEKTAPEFSGAFQEFFILKDKRTGKILPYAKYEITTEDGNVYQGRTDKDGKTITYHTATAQNISVKILEC